MENKRCAFTGHRVIPRDFDINLLDRVIYNLIINGYDRFLCGMAKGFDQFAAESVINYKKKFDLELVACIPCETQTEKYSDSALLRYEKILNSCDEKIVLSDEYFSGCMQNRDRYMVDNCDVLVSLLRKSRGGTFYTVNYARSKGVKIIEL